MKQRNERILIIGGGAAGFFAAIRCAEENDVARVSIWEQAKAPLGKVKISGGGRCNVTHACFEPAELVNHYPRGKKELLGPFHKFMTGDTISWFEDRGVPLKIEADGRMFPISDKSESIIQCLSESARKAGIKIYLKKAARNLTLSSKGWEVTTSDAEQHTFDKVLVASGSAKQMYGVLESLGHTIEEPVPSLFTFNIEDPLIPGLAGQTHLVNVQVEGSPLSETGNMLITHWGLSGPPVLRLSAWGARYLHAQNYKFTLTLNFLPEWTEEKVLNHFYSLRQDLPSTFLSKKVWPEFTNRLWQRILELADIPREKRWADMSNALCKSLATTLTTYQLQVNGKSTFKEEFVTCGGVKLDEVDFRSMQSRKFPNLFFAGEVLDIDAITGGFNFQAAWTTGWIAGGVMAK
ncbi:MAG: NAD(P)/FAD-dependent oxidoreductase [Bacteroidota bacterium]